MAVAATIASSLQPLWLRGARIREGQDWFTSVLDDFRTSEQETVPAIYAGVLTTCGFIAGNTDGPHIAQRYFAEGVPLARSLRDTEILRQIRLWQGNVAFVAGDVVTARAAAEAAVAVAVAADCGEYVLGLAESAMAVTALAAGDVASARRWADDAVDKTAGWHLMMAPRSVSRRFSNLWRSSPRITGKRPGCTALPMRSSTRSAAIANADVPHPGGAH